MHGDRGQSRDPSTAQEGTCGELAAASPILSPLPNTCPPGCSLPVIETRVGCFGSFPCSPCAHWRQVGCTASPWYKMQ